MHNFGKKFPALILAVCVGVIVMGSSLFTSADAAKLPSPFPAGMGVWKWTSTMGTWCQYVGITWYQNWSGAYSDKGKPYIFEIKTANYSDATIQTWLRNRGSHCIGVNIDCEVPKTARTQHVAQMVRLMAPNLKIFSGNLDWALKPQNNWNWTNGIMCFYNCTRYNRCAADVFYFVALAGYYKKPLCFSVQGQDAEGVPPRSITEFKQALTYATNCEGQIIWPADRLAVNNWTSVNNALKYIVKDVYRPDKLVRLSGNLYRDMALCRIVGYKGFRPVGSTTGGVNWSNITVPSTYFSNLTKFHDTGSTKAAVITQERNMVVRW